MKPENGRRGRLKIEEMSKEQIRRAIVKKRETSELAQRIVESLLEPGVSQAAVLSSLPYINQCHMEDVVEERSIIHLCGYPICSNKLMEKDIPKQQYRICIKNNKVYDITMRKNFCSNKCFEGANFIKAQMLKSPLWFREYETIPKFHLMPEKIKTSMGQEVDLEIIEKIQYHKPNSTFTEDFPNISFKDINDKVELLIKKSDKSSVSQIDLKNVDTFDGTDCDDKTDTKVSEQTENSHGTKLSDDTEMTTTICDSLISDANIKASGLQKTINFDRKILDGVSVNERKHTESEMVHYDEKDEIIKLNTKQSLKSKRNTIRVIGEVLERPEKIIDPIITSMTDASTKNMYKIQQKQTQKKETTSSLIMHAEKSMAEWLTLDSMIFLFGKAKVQEIVTGKGECFKDYLNNMANGLNSATSYDQYQQLCQKLNKLELEDHRYDSKILDREMKPPPDYSVLKEESKKIELKVRSFLTGELEIAEPSQSAQLEKAEDNGFLTQLAFVDKYAQNALRRKIFLTSLNKILKDVQRSLGLQGVSIASDVRLLVNSFKLTPNNIMFKPILWPLIGMVVIKLLSLRDLGIHQLLQMEHANCNIQLILLSYKQDGGYLNRLVWWLTDIDRLLDINNTQLTLV